MPADLRSLEFLTQEDLQILDDGLTLLYQKTDREKNPGYWSLRSKIWSLMTASAVYTRLG